MAEYQDGRIQDGWHHQDWVRMNEFESESEWSEISFFSQIQSGDNKESESKMGVAESDMTDNKMAAIIKLSQKEWVKFYFVQMAD